jgi:hypothetical protein
MADQSTSPAFNPPFQQIIGDDSQIVKVPMDKVDWAFRKSQQTGKQFSADEMRLGNLKNGQ